VIQNATFLMIVAITTVAFFALILDFVMPVFWAAVLAIVFFPLQRRYVEALRGWASVATLLTMVTILTVVVAPLALVAVAMTREALALQEQIASGAIDVRAPLRLIEDMAPLAGDLLERFGVDLDGLAEQLSSAAVGVTRFLASRLLSIGQDVLRITALFFVMLYVLFFFLRDGLELIEAIARALPLGDVRERRLLARFADVTRATIKGTLVVGVVQGALGGIAFWLLGRCCPPWVRCSSGCRPWSSCSRWGRS
jgi:predicted PurR-regulated permease PerM